MVKTQNFVIWIQKASLFVYKTDDTYKAIAEYVETIFDT